MKKYYRTTIRVDVLSEEPFEYLDLASVHEKITHGECSGTFKTIKTETLTGKQMAPSADSLSYTTNGKQFFNLDQSGNELEAVW